MFYWTTEFLKNIYIYMKIYLFTAFVHIPYLNFLGFILETEWFKNWSFEILLIY